MNEEYAAKLHQFHASYIPIRKHQDFSDAWDITGIYPITYGSGKSQSECLYCKSISDGKANCRNCGAPTS